MMKLQIERPYMEAMVSEFPGLSTLMEQLKFGNRVEIAFSQLSCAELDFLGGLYRQAGPDMQARAAQLSTLQHALSGEGEHFAASDLEMVLPAIVRYLTRDAVRGWLFTANVTVKSLPYLITRLDYVPDSNDETGKIFIELKANAKGAVTNALLRIT